MRPRRTHRARTNAAEIIVAVDPGGVAVGEGDLDGIIPYRGSRSSARLGFKHRQSGGGRTRCAEFAFFFALVVAGCTGAMIAQEVEVVMARMAIGPSDVHASAAGDVDLYAGGLVASVDRDGHGNVYDHSLQAVRGKGKRTGRRGVDATVSEGR
jgi:hypothetical protein